MKHRLQRAFEIVLTSKLLLGGEYSSMPSYESYIPPDPTVGPESSISALQFSGSCLDLSATSTILTSSISIVLRPITMRCLLSETCKSDPISLGLWRKNLTHNGASSTLSCRKNAIQNVPILCGHGLIFSQSSTHYLLKTLCSTRCIRLYLYFLDTTRLP